MNHLNLYEMNTSDALLLVDNQFILLDLNEVAKNYVDQNLKGQSLLNIVDPKHHSLLTQTLLSSVNTSCQTLDVKIRSQNRLMNLSLVIYLYNESSQYLIHIKESGQDANDKRKHYFNAKLTAVGEMAGGIAHEINTPMGVILGSAKIINEECKIESPKIDKITKNVERIILSTERITRIVKSLRNVSRNDNDDPITLHPLKQIIEDVLALSEEKYKMSSTPLIMPEEITYNLPCRPIQIMQVILNLLNNSLDAIQTLEEKWVRLEILDIADYIEISVTDSGPGIPKNVVEKMMQPFFTTKGIGKGTGLGLSISKSIIEEHNGNFFYDDKSTNTRFVIQIPK